MLWSYEKRCELPYEKRPMFGRHMIPDEVPIFCSSYYDLIERRGMIKKLITDWKPYTFDLFRLAQKYFDANWGIYCSIKLNLNI